jgi:hypothetical protein
MVGWNEMNLSYKVQGTKIRIKVQELKINTHKKPCSFRKHGWKKVAKNSYTII